MAKGKNQHVVPHKEGWAIRGAGNQKVTKVVPTQGEATQYNGPGILDTKNGK